MNRLARFVGFGTRGRNTLDGDSAAEQQPFVDVERMDPEELREPIVAAMRTVFDPEIPVNIYDLGLIYRIGISIEGNVDVDMTLTAPACPVAGTMPRLVEDALGEVEGVGEVRVDLVWDPPWTPDKMTEEARLELGMM